MRKISTAILTVAFTAGILSSTIAADVKKNPPKNRRAVEEVLKAIGGDHDPEHMKVTEVGTVETDSTFYHVYCGTLREGGYRLIFFDNTPKYLGYYTVQLEPTDTGEGELILQSESSSSQGNTDVTIPIPDKGPAARIQVEGVPVKFVKAPEEKKEEPAAEGTPGAPATEAKEGSLPVVGTGAEATTEEPEKPAYEYRDWTIIMSGKEIPVKAIFVDYKDGKVTIKNAKTGTNATIPVSALSEKDKAYLKTILK